MMTISPKTQTMIKSMIEYRKDFWGDDGKDEIIIHNECYEIIRLVKKNEELNECKRLIIVHCGFDKLSFKNNWNEHILTKNPVIILTDEGRYNIDPTDHEFFTKLERADVDITHAQYLSQCDPVSRFYGLKQGDVVKIGDEIRVVNDNTVDDIRLIV